MLKLTNITKTFNPGTITEKKALRGIDLTLEDGDFVTVIGGNGAGKSTLLNLIAGVHYTDTGSIELDGMNLTHKPEYYRARFLGRVFQDPMMGTAPDMQIVENLALAYRRGKSRTLRWGTTSAEKAMFREKLSTLGLGLEDRMTTKVGELIKKGREEKNLSMRQLAELANVSHSDISRIESGEREVPNPKVLRKISKYIGINYNDLMYASGLGAQVSKLNPYLTEYYNNLKGDDLRIAYKNLQSAVQNNNIVIESLKKQTEDESIEEEKKNVLLETIEDLEYQNETNEEILKLLKGNAAEEFIGDDK